MPHSLDYEPRPPRRQLPVRLLVLVAIFFAILAIATLVPMLARGR